MAITTAHALEVVAALDIDLHAAGVCLACLSFVTFAIDEGDERAIRRETFAMARALWEDGLALPLQASLERARRAGVPQVEAAIEDVAARGHRSPVVRAVIRRLAQQLLDETGLPKRGEVIPLGRTPPPGTMAG